MELESRCWWILKTGKRLKTRGLGDNKVPFASDVAGKLQSLAETPKPLFVKKAQIDQMSKRMNQCPICLSYEIRTFFHLKNSPILQNVLFKTENEAKTIERVNVAYMYCPECHFVFNPQFHESKVDYTEQYNNNQLASKTYRQYIDNLINKIINVSKLDSKSRILEIGCGNGYFLYQLSKSLQNQDIVGYDPAYNGQYGMSDFIKKSYFRPIEGNTFDLIILRHVMEGLLNFDNVFTTIPSAMNNHSQLFIETPNLDYIIDYKDMSLLYHEVARYYSIKAIQRLLSNFGLELQQVYLLFNENNLGVFARKRPAVPNIDSNSATYDKLGNIVSGHNKVVIWGISGRAISVLANMSWGKERVQFGVDIDRDKQGKYIPVTGQLIISPEQAVSFGPDLVIVANANYLDEIRNEFSYKCKLLTLDGTVC